MKREKLANTLALYYPLAPNSIKECFDEVISILREEPKQGEWITSYIVLPSIQQNKWVYGNTKERIWKCSACNEVSCCKANFCPNCGARLEWE